MKRFAMVGAGFWARYQLGAWSEVPEANCVAVCDVDLARAQEMAGHFGISGVYSDLETMLQKESLDFVDIVTSPNTHHALVLIAAKHSVPVICQKPMATSLADAEEMVQVCCEANVPFFVHENWRWQRPLRELKAVLDCGILGKVFRAHFAFRTGYPVLDNQPYLAEAEEYILSDMGTHILDVARFFFGEADRLYCQFHRVHPHIKGEDAATVVLSMSGVTVVCDMAEAETPLEHDRGDTFAFLEADQGSAELTADCWLRVTTKQGTISRRVAPQSYPWAHPDYMLYQSAMADCHANLFAGLTGTGVAETTGEDNIRTVRLVYAAYESGRTGQAVSFRRLS
jgi:predicted dehydrogenase